MWLVLELGQDQLTPTPPHLVVQHEASPDSPAVKDTAHLLYQTCLLESGERLAPAGAGA
jgi:hypothetical protein